jgi:hypothetical protein
MRWQPEFFLRRSWKIALAVVVLSLVLISLTLYSAPSSAQISPQTPGPAAEPQKTGPLAGGQIPDQRSGTISGTVMDRTGAVVAGARVKLARPDQSSSQEVVSGSDGQFSFASVLPGSFQLTVTSAGFAPQAVTLLLHPGEIFLVPPIPLTVATTVTQVDVALSPVEVAEEQIKDQEKQRVLGVIPNFYVSYDHNPVPLSSKQKFKLAWKMTVDPVTFAMIGAIAGVQQANNSFSGYGQGAQGYAKRYAASYADLTAGTFIGSAILPSLLKQDPRYFYKGSGTKRSRILYALANAVVCRGDNGSWQANYSSILGNLAAGGISNLYYPAESRQGATLTIENALVGIGATAAANVLQEFFMRKVTSNAPGNDPAKP